MKDLKPILADLTSLLKQKQLRISTAESCTGGLVAACLTDLPGSSLWFERGFVTYSNLAKHELLDVDLQLIQSRGAVSQEVAEKMALGALAHSRSEVALAITGIAGPGGGSVEKPVGLVWFAWVKKQAPVYSQSVLFSNQSRASVRNLACQKALEGAIAYLNSF